MPEAWEWGSFPWTSRRANKERLEIVTDFDFVFDDRKILSRLGHWDRPAGPSDIVREAVAAEIGEARCLGALPEKRARKRPRGAP